MAIAQYPATDSLVVGYANGEIWVRSAIDPSQGRLLGKQNQRVFDLAIHPNGSEVLSVGWDRTRTPLKIWGEWHRWSLHSASHQLVVDTVTHPVSTVAYSPSGSSVAIGCWQHAVRWQDATTGVEHWRYDILANEPEVEYAALQDISVSPGGNRVAAVGKDKRLRIFDTATGHCERVLAQHTQWANAVCWVDSVRLVSGGGDGMAYLWDAPSGQLLATFFGHEGPIEAMVALPGGRVVVAGSRTNRLTVYDVLQTPNPFVGSHSEKGAWHSAFSPDGKYAAICSSDPVVSVIKTEGVPRAVGIYRGHNADVVGFSYHPTRPWIASVGDDGWCRVWDYTTCIALDSVALGKGRYNMVRWSDNGTQAVAVGPDVRILVNRQGRLATEQQLTYPQESFYDVIEHPTTGRLTVAGRSGHLYDWQPGTDTLVRRAWHHTGVANRLARHPSKDVFASTGQDGKLALWRATDQQPFAVLLGHTNYTAGLAFSPSGDRLASCSYDFSLRLWDWQRSAEVLNLQGFADEPYTLAFNPRTADLLVALVTGDFLIYRVPPPAKH